MLEERSTFRKGAIALLVALVASFALSARADAAPKKPVHVRAKHATRSAAAAKPAVRKKAVRKKVVRRAVRKSARKSVVKRKPTTKPR
jgi:hypothetical protein